MKTRVSRENITFFDVIGKSTICVAAILFISVTALWPQGGLAMKAGVSTKDITPPLRTRLSDQARYNTGVHDPLFAKALVLDDGENAVAIVCLDLCIADVEFCDELRERIRERTGIEEILNLPATHLFKIKVRFNL